MNPSTAFATVLVDELARCGLAEAVVAPGSRNAPLAIALWEHAERSAGRLRLHVRIDERSAAFLALGLAKVSRRPVAVVCTSGTAAAHFHAAVIEADEAAVPEVQTTATGRRLTLASPSARNAADRSSIRTCSRSRPALRSACSHSAIASGALRDPGAMTASASPHRASSSTSVVANAVEEFTTGPGTGRPPAGGPARGPGRPRGPPGVRHQ